MRMEVGMDLLFKRAGMSFLVGTFLLFPIACSNSKKVDDNAITKDIQAKLASDPATSDSTVSVSSTDGKVTYKGVAKDASAQQRLAQIAREEPGTTGVDDQTAVVPSGGAAEQAAEPQAAPAAGPTPVATPSPTPAQVEAPKPQPIVVPAGTALVVTVDQALSSKTSQAGSTFLATLAQPVTINGKTAIPKGSSATGTVITAKAKGKIKGEGQLAIALTNITIGGRNYSIQTATLDSTVKGKGKRTAATTGGGAAGGALIGGLAGGGKGAGIGALVGAGAGLVGGAFTGNKQIEIPAETPLTFTLSNPVTLPPR
jgi:BON domain